MVKQDIYDQNVHPYQIKDVQFVIGMVTKMNFAIETQIGLTNQKLVLIKMQIQKTIISKTQKVTKITITMTVHVVNYVKILDIRHLVVQNLIKTENLIIVT